MNNYNKLRFTVLLYLLILVDGGEGLGVPPGVKESFGNEAIVPQDSGYCLEANFSVHCSYKIVSSIFANRFKKPLPC